MLMATYWTQLSGKPVVQIPEVTFEEKLSFLTNRLGSIKAELLEQKGEEVRNALLDGMDRAIEETEFEGMKKMLEIRKNQIAAKFDETEVFFYKHGYVDPDSEEPSEYIAMPRVCAAQGQRWYEPMAGLIFTLIDPTAKNDFELYSVTIPEADENMASVFIPAKHINTAFGYENDIYNKMIFNNAMQYVYKFFEGRITPKELDDAIAEVIELGQNDRTVIQLFIDAEELEAGSAEKDELYLKVEKAQFFPDIKIEKRFKKSNYVFKYDNDRGTVIIEYPLAEMVREHQE